jgi:hypothetical protein
MYRFPALLAVSAALTAVCAAGLAVRMGAGAAAVGLGLACAAAYSGYRRRDRDSAGHREAVEERCRQLTEDLVGVHELLAHERQVHRALTGRME